MQGVILHMGLCKKVYGSSILQCGVGDSKYGCIKCYKAHLTIEPKTKHTERQMYHSTLQNSNEIEFKLK